MTNYYTENLADFGFREIKMLNEILTAWIERGLPDNFWHSGVRPAFNRNSGSVFLVNEDYQVAMLNGEKLEIFHSLPYSGEEGFLEDLYDSLSPDCLNEDDIAYLLEAVENSDTQLNQTWRSYMDVKE